MYFDRYLKNINFSACYSTATATARHQFTPNLNNTTANPATTNAGAGFPFNHSWMTGGGAASQESSSLHSVAPVSSPHKNLSIAGLQQQQSHGQLQQSELNVPTSKHSNISSAFVNATSSGSGLHYFPPMFWPSYRAAAAAAVAAAAAATSPTGKIKLILTITDSRRFH